MAAFISAWSSKISHITDENNDYGDGPIKTRCGRTLTTYQFDYPGERICLRCGGPGDFTAIQEQKHKEHLAQQEVDKKSEEEREKRHQQRIKKHRELMASLQKMLDQRGAKIVNVQGKAAGGSIEFEIDSLKFKLSGNIW